MTLLEKILDRYPELANSMELFVDGTIVLQDDSDGNGPYIGKWVHPTLVEPIFE